MSEDAFNYDALVEPKAEDLTLPCHKRGIVYNMMRSGKYIAEPAESEAVRQIFEIYLSGMSLKSIATEMTVPYNADKVI